MKYVIAIWYVKMPFPEILKYLDELHISCGHIADDQDQQDPGFFIEDTGAEISITNMVYKDIENAYKVVFKAPIWDYAKVHPGYWLSPCSFDNVNDKIQTYKADFETTRGGSAEYFGTATSEETLISEYSPRPEK